MSIHSDRRVTQQWAKKGPPLRGYPEQPRGSVTTLARTTSPRCAPFLATEPLRVITAHQSYGVWF
jgi:hypothetical protein